jgi:hypothetical protein
MGAFAHFVLLPSLLVALTIEPVALAGPVESEAVRRLFEKGRMSRAKAFCGGVLIGLMALGTAMAIGLLWDFLLPHSWWPFFAVLVPIFLGAYISPWWVLRVAQKEARQASEYGRSAP